MSVFLLLALTVGWAVLPLLPALRELLSPSDIEPLTVVGRDAGDVAFFARRFREYLVDQFSAASPGSDALPDGTPVTRLALETPPLPPGPVDRVVVAEPWSSLPDASTCLREVYGAGSLTIGARSLCRAVLAEGDLCLGPGSTVLRWAHAAGRLEAGRGSILHGRASSQSLLKLEERVAFERVGAPRIEIGAGAPEPAPGSAESLPEAWVPPSGAEDLGHHWRVNGNLRIPPGTRLEGHLVVIGSLEVGADALILGNVKARRSILLRERAQITGSLVTQASLSIGSGCSVQGPVLAEGDLSVSSGAILGSRGAPTTVTARVVELQVGTVVHGAITAHVRGRTRT